MSADPRRSLVLTDSHCHLTAEQLAEDLPGVLERAREAGVARIISIASDIDDAAAAAVLAEAHTWIWSTAGVHPHEVAHADPDGDLPRLRTLLSGPRVVAVGETGLDYFYDNAPRDTQREWLGRHLDLAEAADLPLVVHSRSADEDMAVAVGEASRRGLGGVLHCFTGGERLFEVALEAGWYFGYGGITTFGSFEGVELLRRVPADRLLIETDAPYLAPVPMRGRTNEPAYLVHSLRRMAELLDIDEQTLARRTSENAARFFGLPEVQG